MAKRFTDTDKWGKAWFRKLSPKMKCAWEFLRDNCDMAGAWDIDLDSLEFHIGERIEITDILKAFEGRVVQLGNDKLFLVTFVTFQYGELSNECKPHKAVLTRLKKLRVLKGYPKGIHTNKDKDKDKDKDKERLLNLIYEKYPRKEGKSRAFKTLHNLNDEELTLLDKAVTNYATKAASEKTEAKFIKQFSTFANEWRDWIDYKPTAKPVNQERWSV